jgi:hypothetical protein
MPPSRFARKSRRAPSDAGGRQSRRRPLVAVAGLSEIGTECGHADPACEAALWFSSGRRSRKARNLAEDPRCVVTSEDASEPVVIEGTAARVQERDVIVRVAELMNAKYGGITVNFLAANATVRVRPRRVFGIAHDDFTGSPTRWVFD